MMAFRWKFPSWIALAMAMRSTALHGLTAIKEYLRSGYATHYQALGNPPVQDSGGLQHDGLVHVCLYFIAAHRLKGVDLEFMRRLEPHVNLVPIIAKADTMTLAERDAFRRLVLSELKQCGVKDLPDESCAGVQRLRRRSGRRPSRGGRGGRGAHARQRERLHQLKRRARQAREEDISPDRRRIQRAASRRISRTRGGCPQRRRSPRRLLSAPPRTAHGSIRGVRAAWRTPLIPICRCSAPCSSPPR